jgi:hypothetical protein
MNSLLEDTFIAVTVRHRILLLAAYHMTDIINHRLSPNPIADFEFGINAAIIRPENIEPPLIKGKHLMLTGRIVLSVTGTCSRLHRNYFSWLWSCVKLNGPSLFYILCRTVLAETCDGQYPSKETSQACKK